MYIHCDIHCDNSDIYWKWIEKISEVDLNKEFYTYFVYLFSLEAKADDLDDLLGDLLDDGKYK